MTALLALLRAIAAGDPITRVLTEDLARAAMAEGADRQTAKPYFLDDIGHYIYRGDTALHIAAAAHRLAVVRALLRAGAKVDARNRMGAAPLHYAADGRAGARSRAQVATIGCLVAAGAAPDVVDRHGVTPLHRAVRTRSAAAVEALLTAGADPHRKNRSGSTPLRLATLTTGASGSGSPEAKAAQAAILRLLAR
jgi:hypothetical protein